MNSDITPQLIAHRGYSSQYPENTLLSFEQALLAGACYVECDVQLTKDNTPIVIHDAELERTTGVQGNVHEELLSDIIKLNAGFQQRFADKYSQVTIPALSELVALMQRWPARKAFVEIKRSSIRAFGRTRVLQQITNILQAIRQQVILISFDYELVKLLRETQEWQVGWIVGQWSEDNLQRADQLSPDFVFVHHGRLPKTLVSLPRASWNWVVYEIDDPQLALEWIDRGALFIETNDIGLMLQAPGFNDSACHDNSLL